MIAFGLVLSISATLPAAAPPDPYDAVPAIVELADNLDRPDLERKARYIVSKYDSCDISQIFQPKSNGGAGIGSAVQAGHKDSIKSLVQHWSGPKPPTEIELRTHRKDLLKTARVLKVMAELAPFRLALIVPKNDAKKVEFMNKVIVDFKASTRDLHDAIEKTEPVATRKAAVFLNQTCNNCHELR
jgi:hypothetical protein